MSSVAMMPTGSGNPQMSPTSRPTLSGLLTPTPTNSNSGCLTISAITILPTKPVPYTTTRFEPLCDMLTFRSPSPQLTDSTGRTGAQGGFEVFGAAKQQGGELPAPRGEIPCNISDSTPSTAAWLLLRHCSPSRRQLQRAGPAPSRRRRRADQSGRVQPVQHVTQRLAGDEAQPGKFGGRRVGMVVQGTQQRVLRHRQPDRLQRGIAAAPQPLLHPLHQIARTTLNLRFPMTGTLHHASVEYVRFLTYEKVLAMTEIKEHAPLTTLINVFTVEPERAAELAEKLRLATEETMQFVPGFISANIHVSTDAPGWSTTPSGRAPRPTRRCSKTRTLVHTWASCAAVATSFEPHLYTVESVHQASNV